MNGRTGWSVRVALAVLVVALTGVVMGAGASSAHGDAARTRGCHTWAPVFRPVLSDLSLAGVLVALPTHVPHFGRRVYVHANVLSPPLTYDVALSTRAGTGWPVPVRTTLLTVHGTAGLEVPPAGSTTRVVGGKRLNLLPGSSRIRSVLWRDRAAHITYSVGLPARLGIAALLRVAGSLTPAPLRRSPITSGTPVPFNPCP